MPIQWTTNAQKCWPPAADGVSLVPSGSAWTNSAFVEIEDSTAAACVLTGVILRTAGNGSIQFEVDVATGAAASETVIATVKGMHRGAGASSHAVSNRFVFPIPVDAIANGARVSARIRTSNSDTTSWNCSLQYYEKPITGNLDVSSKPVKVLPTSDSVLQVDASVTPWAFGNWVQLTAATAAAWVVDGVTVVSGGDWEVQIGTGSGGAEAAITTIRGYGDTTGGFGFRPLNNPLDNIANGVRVALRSRAANALQQVFVALSYREKPL